MQVELLILINQKLQHELEYIIIIIHYVFLIKTVLCR